MQCLKVVYLSPTTSSYCGLPVAHEGECKYIPAEYIVQFCKNILLERGEVQLPIGQRCGSRNPENTTVQCGLPQGHKGRHGRAPYYSWSNDNAENVRSNEKGVQETGNVRQSSEEKSSKDLQLET